MNRAITIIVILLVMLLVGYLIAGFLGPQGFKMERSIEIKAPRAAIYRNISDYNNWMKWSPWAGIDSACKYDYYGSQEQIGAGYKWKGNDKAGEGDMHTTDMIQNSSLSSKLTFLKPWPGEAMATFRLEDDSSGMTKVIWGFSQSYSFGQRPMMLFMNMEKMLGPDYERGLAKLKEVSEKEAASMGIKVIETTWAAHTYLASRAVVDMKDLGKVFMDKMPKTGQYVQKNKLSMDGPPSGLYFTWDTAAGRTDLAVAVPVKDAVAASGGYTIIRVERSNALLVDYYGPYDHMTDAHNAIQKYARDKGMKLKTPVIEEYIGDPGVEKDPSKVLTKVYYLIEG
jgi:effector-binding domain-containing protein